MHFVDRTLRWQRRLLAAILVGSTLGFWRGSYDVFNTFKATLVMLGAIGIMVAGALRVARTRRMLVPAGWAWVPAAAFAVGLVVATVAADRTMTAVVGRSGRHTGLALYLVYLLLFLVTARLYRTSSPAHLAKTLVVVAVPVSVYGLLQRAGVEPYGWDTIEGGPQVFATFGNANFFSAWLGIVVPVALYGALTRTWTTPWRVVSALLALAALGAQLASDSLQGPLAAAMGSTLVLVAWLFSTQGRIARRRVRILTASLGAVAAASVAFLAGLGPLGALRDQAYRSFQGRTGHWETAVNMAAERPVFGYGLGSFGDWAYRFRPEWFALDRGLTRSSDSAHSVPLEMLANGGALLLLGYLAFVGLAAWAMIRGLRGLAGEDRLLLAGFAGAWLAYQTQSLLSIDVPPLAVLHYVLAGVLVARGLAPRWREKTLPGAPAVAFARPGKKRKAKKPAAVPLVPLHPGIVAVITLGALGLVWLGSTPLRADMAAQDGRNLAAAGDTRAADAAFKRASGTAFWEARYPALHAVLLTDMGQKELARDAYRTAAAREPRGLAHTLNAGRLSANLGEEEEADAWFARALELDPKTPETLAEVGRWKLMQEEHDEAQRLLERATALRHDNADWWVALGQARSADGDEEGARAAFQRALDIDPDAEGAEEAMEELAARA